MCRSKTVKLIITVRPIVNLILTAIVPNAHLLKLTTVKIITIQIAIRIIILLLTITK